MKKFLKILGVVVLLLLGAIVAFPFLFKDKIRASVEQEISNSVDANVWFGDFGLTMFRNFPNLTATLNDFGVSGKGVFQGDTLVAGKKFGLVIDLWSVIAGDRMVLKKVELIRPVVRAIVLKNGKNNWDIFKSTETETTAPADTGTVPFDIRLQAYELKEANIRYDDWSGDMHLDIGKMDHSGSGAFTEKQFDLDTRTLANAVTIAAGGTRYLNNGDLDLDINVSIDSKNNRYVLNKNRLQINAMILSLSGEIIQKEDETGLDLTLFVPENSFKNVLSLVPGTYTSDFEDMETEGRFTLEGWVKGVYGPEVIPAFSFNLGVQKGMFHYPELPTAVSNIDLDLKLDCPDGKLEHLKVNIPAFHADLGNNPVDAVLKLTGVTGPDIAMEGQVKADLNLDDFTRMFRLEGQELRGRFSVDATALGTYNEKAGTFPKVTAEMSMKDGYYKSSEFPSAVERITFSGQMDNSTGKLNDTWIKVQNFHSEIDGEPIDMNLTVSELDDPRFDISLKGSADLQKISKIYPVEGTQMTGKITANVQTQGKVSDAEAGRYFNIPTSGSLTFNKISYSSTDIPQGVKVSSGLMNFTPQQVTVESLAGYLGKSGFSIKGALSNYIPWLFMDDKNLKGNFTFVSPEFDVNEWLSAEGDPSGKSAQTSEDTELSVIEVPEGLDFTLNSSISTVHYDNLTLKDVRGLVIVRDQEIRFENLSCNLLGGQIALKGNYNTRNVKKPLFGLTLDVRNMKVHDAWEQFSTVRALAPVAEHVNGLFNTAFSLSGSLQPDMQPDLPSLTGNGNLLVTNATVQGSNVLNSLNQKTGLAAFRELSLRDLKIIFDVKDGRLFTRPFMIRTGNVIANISGSNGIDGSLDYDLKMDIPAGTVGASAVNSLSGLTGKTFSASDRLNVDLKLGGTYKNPRIAGAGTGVAETLKEEVESQVREKVEEVKDQAQQRLEEEKKALEDKAKEELDRAKKQAEEEAARLKKEAEEKARKEQERLKKEAEEKARKEKERQEEEAKKKLEEEKDKLKDKLKWPR